jgi:hypothetical protein
MKKQLFTTAWELFKNGVFGTFAESLKAAWNKSKLQKALKSGVAKFTFTKADGTERKAVGTLNDSNFQYEAKGTNEKKSIVTIVKFWDMEKMAFRCLNIQNFVRFD